MGNSLNMHLGTASLGSAVIGCGYGAPQPITALPKEALYSLICEELDLIVNVEHIC